MRGPKQLLYPAALVVMIWGINGVMTSQPDKSSAGTSVVSTQNRTSFAHASGRSAAAMSVAATLAPDK